MSTERHAASSTEEKPQKHAQLRSAGELVGQILITKQERAAIEKLFTKHTSRSTLKTPVASNTLASFNNDSDSAIRPIALPQISPWPTSPIMRAYGPYLGAHDIPAPLFLRIIDAYNLATSASPSMQVLDAAGAILGLVSEPHVQIAAQAIDGAAAVGEAELSRARGDIFVRKANREILEAKGLRMEVVKGKDLAGVLGLGKDERLPVMPPIDKVDAGLKSESEVEVLSTGSTNAERRVRELGSLVADVTFCVPAPEEQTKKVQTYLAGEQRKELEKYREKQDAKMEKQLQERKEKEAKMAEKMQKIESRAGKDRGKANEWIDKERRREEQKRVESMRRKLEKLQWLVFRRL